MSCKQVLILNLDAVKKKNMYQVRSLQDKGFHYYIFSYSGLVSLPKQSIEPHCSMVYRSAIMLRVLQVFIFLMKHHQIIHHVELYTGMGSFLLFEYVLCKIFRIPVIVIERGSPLRDLNCYSWLGRKGRSYIYKNAECLWIRELWMVDKLRELGRDNFFFLSNSIEIPKQFNHSFAKSFDFIWVNSLHKIRNVEWFLKAINSVSFRDTNNKLYGLLNTRSRDINSSQDLISSLKLPNLTIESFCDPTDGFLNSRFFVLPADVVYLNFALLEAMAYGVVPIISNVPGASDIVTHGVDGFIVDHNPEGLRQGMLKAMQLPAKKYSQMSFSARNKVITKFSIVSWADQLHSLYAHIGN